MACATGASPAKGSLVSRPISAASPAARGISNTAPLEQNQSSSASSAAVVSCAAPGPHDGGDGGGQPAPGLDHQTGPACYLLAPTAASSRAGTSRTQPPTAFVLTRRQPGARWPPLTTCSSPRYRGGCTPGYPPPRSAAGRARRRCPAQDLRHCIDGRADAANKRIADALSSPDQPVDEAGGGRHPEPCSGRLGECAGTRHPPAFEVHDRRTWAPGPWRPLRSERLKRSTEGVSQTLSSQRP
jgi:hypothetical protein